MTAAWKRGLARGLLGFLFKAHFMRRRALALLSRHYTKGELTLRYRMPDHTLFLDPGDDVIAARVLLRGDWQRRDLERTIAMLKLHVPGATGKLFVDAGANIGTETIYAMLSGFFSGAVSIEPEPRNFALLRENVEVNGLTARVHCVNCAAGQSEATQVLARSDWNKGGHAIGDGKAGVTVKVLPLPAILKGAGYEASDVGLVWIDVNGTEMQVLDGMRDMLAMRVPVVIEHLPGLISADAARAVHALLAMYYRSFVRIDVADGAPAPLNKMDPLRHSGDFLFF